MQSNKNTTALISGANGFVGQHLTRTLRQKNIIPFELPRELLYTPADGMLRKFLVERNPDYIFALHSYGNMRDQQDEDPIIMANYFATWNLLRASKEIPYKAFINVASSSMYGKKRVQMNEWEGMHPDTFYGASKLAAAALARAYNKQYKKPVATVIPFSIYGPQEAMHRFIPTVVTSILKETSFPLNEKQKHDWIYIDDFIRGMLFVAEEIEELQGEYFNIGTGFSYTNKQVCEMISEIMKKPFASTTASAINSYDSPAWVADMRLMQALGFKHEYSLADGLQKTIDFYKKQYQQVK